MRRFLLLTAVWSLATLGAAGTANAQFLLLGEYTLGVRQIDLSANSSKFNEYRDLRDGFYLDRLKFSGRETGKSLFLEFDGRKVLRDDQALYLRLGDYGARWNLVVEHRETPHRLSNKAMSP